jgi:N-acetylmuramoyl-L-alanine amidase
MGGNLKSKLVLLLFLMACATSFAQGNSKFRVVLDAGHGGKDYGAIYHGFTEKNIVLDVALKVGKLLEKYQDVQVIYTRKTDVFIELAERPRIANKADANLFVSIHCNGETKKTAFGTETFVIGPTKNASQLEVAKAENAVMNMEKDKSVYGGFDPNSPETLLNMQILQEDLVNQSIGMASKIQNGFDEVLKRKSRGVKQAPFWVLHKTAMPSILIELGFISYQSEGEYLNSEKGKNDMAEVIAKAIIEYKKENFIPGTLEYVEPVEKDTPKPTAVKDKDTNKTSTVKKDTATVKTPVADKAPAAVTAGVVFKVQIAAGGKSIDTTPANFKGLKSISKLSEGNLFKYYYGETDSFTDAKKLLAEAKAKGYSSAFVVAFKDGKKISIEEATKK